MTVLAEEIAAICTSNLHQSPVPHSTACPFKLLPSHTFPGQIDKRASAPLRAAFDHVPCLQVALLWDKITAEVRWLTYAYPLECATLD